MEGILKNVTPEKAMFFNALNIVESAGVVATRTKGYSVRHWVFWWDSYNKEGGFEATHSIEANFDFTPQGVWIYDGGDYGLPPDDKEEFEEYYYSIKAFLIDHAEDIFKNDFDYMLTFVEGLAQDVKEVCMSVGEAEES